MGPSPVSNRYQQSKAKQSKIMQSFKILIAVLALAGASALVPEDLISESSTALSDAQGFLHDDLTKIFKVDQNTQFMSTALLKTITKNRQDFDNDMELWGFVKKAGAWAYAQLKKAAAALCRKGLAYVAGRAIDELFKKAIQVCAQLCVRVASYIAVSGGANPASIAVAAAIGSGCGFACKSAADYLRKVMNNNQLTDTVFANWVCNKLGLTGRR